MAYGQWKIDYVATLEEFGYSAQTLSYGSKRPVKCVCESCGMVANKRFRESNAKHICKSIIEGEKRCYKCKTFKPVGEFSKNKSTFDGYQKCCKECFSNYDSVKKHYKEKSNKRKSDLKTYLIDKTSSIKRKSIRKNIEFDLDKEYIFNLHESQNGKCYYTGIDIRHNIGCHQYDSITLERLDSNKGYTKDNVVLAAFAINSFKGMMSETEFKNFLGIVIPRLIEYKNKL